ncbi:MAG: hypothetical protein WA655_15640 [Candidatus Korobacteraceae bacterium]
MGEAILGFGIFGWAIRILDLVGRAEVAVDLYRLLPKFLLFAENPAFQAALIAIGFLLLWKYTQSSTRVSQSQLVHPVTKLPFEHPVYPAFRRALFTFVVSIAFALTVFAVLTNPLRSYWSTGSPPSDYHIGAPTVAAQTATPHTAPAATSPPPLASENSRGHSKAETGTQGGATAPPMQVSNPSSPATPSSAPSTIIPTDPEKAVEAVTQMRNGLSEILSKKETITFLMNWPDDDNSNLAFISQIFSSACRSTPRQCWFVQKTDPRNLDYPPIPEPSRRGLTIHGADAQSLASQLGRWFTTYSSSSIPKALNAYKDQNTKELIWVEIGPGSPWRTTN